MCAKKAFLKPEEEVERLRIRIAQLAARSRPAPTACAHCLFGINVEQGMPFGSFIIRVFQPGEGDGPAKELRLGPASVQALLDPTDCDIIERLYGVQDDAGSDSTRALPAVHLRGKAAGDLLPALVATGRLFPMTDSLRTLYMENPIDLETELPPWQFAITAKEHSFGEQRFTGVMRRGEQIRELSSFSVFTGDGWLLDEHRLDRFEIGHGRTWFQLLREQPFFTLKTRNMPDFLARVCDAAPLPPIIRSAGLHPRILQGCKPVPLLHLTPAFTDSYTGELLFAYDEDTIPEIENRTYVRTGAIYIERDPAAERERLQQLCDAGAISTSDTRDRVVGRWHIPSSIVGDAVLKLMSLGWRIECTDDESSRIVVQTGQKWRFFVASGIDWFNLKGIEWSGMATPARIDMRSIMQALAERKAFVRIHGQGLAVLDSKMVQLLQSLAAIAKRKTDGTFEITPEQVALVGSFGPGGIPAVDDNGQALSLNDFRKHLRADEDALQITPEEPPASFVGKLRDYQKYGLGWLHFLQRYRLGGCLADDMGLGKTVQVIALLEQRRLTMEARQERIPSLIVVMASLLGNWHDELAKFAPGLRVLTHYGAGRGLYRAQFASHNIILTTYGTLIRDADWMRSEEFDYVILDEAQQIKNEDSRSAQAARSLKARNRLALTGTPVMNRASELKSLFDFLSPGLFTQLPALEDAAERPVQDTDEARIMGNILRPFILRRKKQDVLKELPARMNKVLFCDLGDEERAEYEELKKGIRSTLIPRIEAIGFAPMRMHVLEAILRLRQMACHPGLIDPDRRNGTSTKLDELFRQIEEVIDEGHKVLVFSQFVSFLTIIRSRLDAHELRDRYLYLDGQTPVHERTKLVKQFQTDENKQLFLISLKAGGLGLNLTAADYVYILDPWWNPSVEDQAIDRAHRIGQTRSVFAYRLISRNTIEEKVLLLQEKKRALVDAILTGENASLDGLTTQDLLMLLS